MIDQELAALFESGIATTVATRDAALATDVARAVGSRARAGSDELEVLLPVATSRGLLANLADNGRIAVIYGRAFDHRSIQVKGTLVSIRDGEEADREHGARFLEGLSEDWAAAGVPRTITRSLTRWPCAVVRFRVEEIYEQTPGPGAGAKVEAGGSGAKR